MNKKTTYVLGIVLTVIFGTILYFNFEGNNTNEANVVNNDVSDAVYDDFTKNILTIIDTKSHLEFNSVEHFNFRKSDFSIIEPVPVGLEEELLKLARYLNDNPNKTIDVIGLYSNDEVNKSGFENLGVARATSVKNYLLSLEIPFNVIKTSGEQKSEMHPDSKNVYHGPLNYAINTVEDEGAGAADVLNLIEQDIKADPLVLYFNAEEAEIDLTSEQREKVSKLMTYVKKKEGALIQVVGYSDKKMNSEISVALGKKRAEFAKRYLVEYGLLESKIRSSSEGAYNPIADNSTAEGRAKNRRVVVTLN